MSFQIINFRRRKISGRHGSRQWKQFKDLYVVSLMYLAW